jgi:hypothetical protein
MEIPGLLGMSFDALRALCCHIYKKPLHEFRREELERVWDDYCRRRDLPAPGRGVKRFPSSEIP